MNASVFRNTRHEIRSIHQGPNAFGLVVVHRLRNAEQAPTEPAPLLEIPEEDFSESEMLQVHAVLEMLEHKYAARLDAEAAKLEVPLDAPVGKVHELVKKAREAEAAKAAADAETARIEAENILRREEQARELAIAEQLRADLAAIQAAAEDQIKQQRLAADEEHRAKLAELAALDDQISKKRTGAKDAA